LAANYLVGQGYQVLEQNFRTPHGEIDLIASRGACLVFVEVKTRTSLSFGYPETALTPKKQAHVRAAAEWYLQSQTGLDVDWRIDVIAIQRQRGSGTPEIVHFENAFS
jgi:putative endonuclease